MWISATSVPFSTPLPKLVKVIERVQTSGSQSCLHIIVIRREHLKRNSDIFPYFQFSSVQWLSRVRLFATPWTAARQASLSITNSWSLLKLMSISDAIQPSHPLSSPSPPAFNLSQHQSLFKWASSSHQVAKVLEFQLQHQSFQWIFQTDILRTDCLDLLAVSLRVPTVSARDSQQSSPTPQFKSINSSVVSFLYSPTLTSINDYWKNHCLD